MTKFKNDLYAQLENLWYDISPICYCKTCYFCEETSANSPIGISKMAANINAKNVPASHAYSFDQFTLKNDSYYRNKFKTILSTYFDDYYGYFTIICAKANKLFIAEKLNEFIRLFAQLSVTKLAKVYWNQGELNHKFATFDIVISSNENPLLLQTPYSNQILGQLTDEYFKHFKILDKSYSKHDLYLTFLAKISLIQNDVKNKYSDQYYLVPLTPNTLITYSHNVNTNQKFQVYSDSEQIKKTLNQYPKLTQYLSNLLN